MFKKSLAHQSNATPLRTSARRQLLASIFTQHPALLDAIPPVGVELNTVAEGVITEKDLGRLVLPDGVRSGAIETSGGIEGIVYRSPDGDPIWMSFGRGSKELIPTLYLLAQPLPIPPLPIIQLHYPIPPPILAGAPLFFPAVRDQARPWLLPDVDEGDLVALATSDSGSSNVVYVGVARVVAKGGMRGALERRRKHLMESVDVDEGKFCEILCIIDDHLWDLGSKPQLTSFTLPPPRKPLVPPQAVADTSRENQTVDDVTEGVAALNMNTGDSTSALVTSTTSSSISLSASEISTLLTASLIQALSTLSPAAFPMPASLLYSAHVLPSRPAYIPLERRDDVVIAKSEWKKLAKWMKEVGKDGLLKVKESKGETIVTGFDSEHRSIDTHVPFLTIADEEKKATKRTAREAAEAPSSGPSKSNELAIEELWKPAGSTVSLWESCGIDKTSLNPSAKIKPLIEEYITAHNLTDSQDRRFIILNEELSSAIGTKGSGPGERVVREEVMRRLRSSVAWSVSIGGVVKKGNLNPISMAVKTRQGRKLVTLISGLESYGVDVDDFADELRKLCAGSASVAPLNGAPAKLNLREVLVQGNQVKLVTEALLARGVPRRWIKEADGDKKGKK